MVKNVANSRCLVDMDIPSAVDARALPNDVYHILREASALFARSTIPGNSRASTSGASNKYGSHAFFIHQHCIVSLAVQPHMIKKISDTIYLQSYFEKKFDSWFLSSTKDRRHVEDCVCEFIDNNLDDSIYLRVNGGLASGLCSYPHFEDDLKRIISLLNEINNPVR